MTGARAGFLIAMSLAALLAGCLASDAPGPAPADGPGDAEGPGAGAVARAGAAFTLPAIVDDLRAGGEPVIAITRTGTILVAAHPGYTHFHPVPVSPELLLPSQTQVYLWRSTDGGESWTHVSLLPPGLPNSGPRGLGQGISDPDLAYDATTGRIWLTDLEALAAASVSWSDDDGETWLIGNDAASGGAIDRQWLAAHDGTVFLTGNYVPTALWPPGSGGATTDFLASEDGLVWEGRGMTPCNGDPVADPSSGTIYQACREGMAVSTDGGGSWEEVSAPIGCFLCEAAVDGAGTVYLAGPGDNPSVRLTHTRDGGGSWSEPLELTRFFPDLADAQASVTMWPWVSAGSPGRVAVTFLAATGTSSATDPDAQWHAYSAIVVNATDGPVEVWPVRLTDTPLHHGAICVGTICQATTALDAAGDRRLGDFFETTVGHDGRLHVVYANTAANPDHAVAHVAFHRQTAGPLLVDGELPVGFPTQG